MVIKEDTLGHENYKKRQETSPLEEGIVLAFLTPPHTKLGLKTRMQPLHIRIVVNETINILICTV